MHMHAAGVMYCGMQYIEILVWVAFKIYNSVHNLIDS